MRSLMIVAALGLAGWFGLADVAAQPGTTARHVQDDVGMFSAEAKNKANAAIAQIMRTYHKDLFIEAAHAPKRPAEISKDDRPAVNRFFDKWAAEKFKNANINGVYVVFVPEASIFRIAVGAQTKAKGLFTDRNRDELTRKLEDKLKSGDKDGALSIATAYVTEAMQVNTQPAVRANPGGNVPVADQPALQPPPALQPSPIMTYVLIGLGILLVFWLISAIVRGFSSMGGGGGYGHAPGYGPAYGGGGGGGGGGGFMTGLLGGLFGAAAGLWAYNHFFGGGTPSAWGGPSSGGGLTGGAGAGPTDVGAGEPSVGGGDYGDPGAAPGGGGDWGGGGGDWGGGDAGGGDVGGGDAGGGGGDW